MLDKSESGEVAYKFMEFIRRQCGNFMLLIGGITDNSVGFLRVQDEADLPQMSPSEFIMIEKIALNWYLFKTT